MLRTIFWTMIFLLGASMVAIQPACQKFANKPIRQLKASTHNSSSKLELVSPNSRL